MKKLISIIALLLIIPCYFMFSEKVEAKRSEGDSFTPAVADDFYTQKPEKHIVHNIKIDAVAMRTLKAAENRDQKALNQCAKEFHDYGITEIYPPEVISKKTPDAPPVNMFLNGKDLTGSTCLKMGYMYKAQAHWVGYCKP